MPGQPKKFRFTLTTPTDSHELLNSPDGWSQTTVEFKRSSTYLGVIRSLTIPFNFVFKGGLIIRSIDYTKGLMGYIKLLIEKLNPNTWGYVPIFNGKIDMTTIEDNKSFVTASVVEDSLQEKIAAFEGITYEIKLDVPQAIQIELTPIPFKEKADYIFSPTNGTFLKTFIGLNLVTNEVHSTVESSQEVDSEHNETPNFSTSNKWFYKATVDTQISINFDTVQGQVNTLVPAHLQIINQNGTVLFNVLDVVGNVNPQSFTINRTILLNVNKDDKLFLYFQANSLSVLNFYAIGNGSMTTNYNTESPASMCNALPASYVFDELIQKMNGKDTGGAYIPYPTSSTLLTSVLKQVAITCSNSIRKIVNGTQYNPGDTLLPGAKYVVINGAITYNSIDYAINDIFLGVEGVDTFTTGNDGSVVLIGYQEVILLQFKDFYQAVKSWMGGNAGFGLDNNVAVLEQITYFFRDLATMDLGKSINGFKSVPATDQVFNSLKVGYEDQQYDTLNGFQEVNSTQIYTGDLTALSKELDLISPIRTDPYGIETLRFTPTDTSASRSDNDVWAIWIKDVPEIGQTYYRPLRNEELISITGIDAGIKYYNWRLTPKQCLLRGAPYLASVFNSQTTLHFTSAPKNVNLITVDISGLRVAERDSVLISSLGTPAFQPRYFKFNCKLANDALNQLNIMYTTVKFTAFGIPLSGFISDVSCDVGQNSQRDFTLLCSPSVDLTTLIRPKASRSTKPVIAELFIRFINKSQLPININGHIIEINDSYDAGVLQTDTTGPSVILDNSKYWQLNFTNDVPAGNFLEASFIYDNLLLFTYPILNGIIVPPNNYVEIYVFSRDTQAP